MNNLITILVALCFVEFAHNAMEIWGIRQKVQWLEQSMRGLEHGRWPIDVDTKVKTIAIHAGILIALGAAAFFSLKLLDLSEKSLLVLGIIVLATSYTYTTWRVDKYHAEIGELIARAKKAKN